MASEGIGTQQKAETFEFTGRRSEFFKLLLINLLLTILTLGIYRFWAKTKVRKFIWSNIRFMGDPLEYTGKATELLLGFLIVLAVLFPLGLVYNLIQFLVPPEHTVLHIGLEILYYVVLLMLIQVGFYRAWRYRMSRTSWRGIRLGLDGSTWAYLKLSIGWTVLTILTLGIAYPWMAIELWKYQISHTRIGETAVSFEGTGKKIFPSWLIVNTPLLTILLGYGVYFSLALDMTAFDAAIANGDGEFIKHMFAELLAPWMLIITGAIFVMWLIAWFWFNLNLVWHQISGISIRSASVQSHLPIWRLLLFAASALVVLGLPVITFSVIFLSSSIGAPSEFIVVLIIFYLLSFLILPIGWTLIYTFEFIKQVFVTAAITNPGVIENAVQSAKESQKTGEGLADALDIGGL